MIIQDYPDELDYVNAKLHPLGTRCGSFLELLLHAALHADAANYELIRPVVQLMMRTYPADADRLEMERRDRGVR